MSNQAPPEPHREPERASPSSGHSPRHAPGPGPAVERVDPPETLSMLAPQPLSLTSPFGPGGWARRLAKLWGFLGFAILVLILARHVVLPFVFGLLIAYILAPAVRRLSVNQKNGATRMPRAAAIVICYVALFAVLSVFMGSLLPRLSKDIARVGREAPSLYTKLNDVWAPRAAAYLEETFPTLNTPDPLPEATPAPDPSLPPGTQLVVTPLPDGRFAVQLHDTGIEVKQHAKGLTLAPRATGVREPGLEQKLRAVVRDTLIDLQRELGNLFRLGQVVLSAIMRTVFTFFLVLMVAAFILLDLGRIQGFVRGLIPDQYHGDYEVIVAGIDRGMSGVIRGQLVICVVNGLLTWVGLVAMGVDYALLLAAVATVLSLIPIFGSILSTVPIVLAALVSGGDGVDPLRALAILGWIVGVHLLEANILNPRIMGQAAHIHPVLVIFALVLGEQTYGLTGALLAVPVASIVRVLFLFFRDKAWRVDAEA